MDLTRPARFALPAEADTKTQQTQADNLLLDRPFCGETRDRFVVKRTNGGHTIQISTGQMGGGF